MRTHHAVYDICIILHLYYFLIKFFKIHVNYLTYHKLLSAIILISCSVITVEALTLFPNTRKGFPSGSVVKKVKVLVTQLCLTLCDLMDCSHQLLCPWDSPGKNTGVGRHFLLQGIFQTKGSNPHLLHWQVDSLSINHQGSPQNDNSPLVLLLSSL